MKSWARFHKDTTPSDETISANAFPVAGRYWAGVSGPGDKDLVPTNVACESLEVAKNKADGLVQAAYPHDCKESKCGAWQELN